MDIIVIPVLLLIRSLVALASFIIIADVIISWLIFMNIFNTNNVFLVSIFSFVSKISGYMLDPIRKRVPTDIASFDLSPVVLILLLTLIDNIIQRILIRFV